MPFAIPKIDTIYLDMDGVLVDDNDMFSRIAPTVGNMKEHISKLKVFGQKQAFIFPLIDEAIKRNLFEKAKKTQFGEVVSLLLLPYWKELGINVEILSSTMKTNPLRKELEDQKIKWLKAHGFGHLKINLVPGSAEKQVFARAGALLIDDYDRTIGQFISQGGYAIQYTNFKEVMHTLSLLNLYENTTHGQKG